MSTKEKRPKKGEWEKEDRRGNWVTWMDAWPEKQRNLSNYSLPLLGLSRYPRHRSYKLTISQRSSIPQPSLSSTIRFLLFVSLPYLFAFTPAFISTDIYHDFFFPLRSILIQAYILKSAQHSSWVWGDPFKILARVFAPSAGMDKPPEKWFWNCNKWEHLRYQCVRFKNAFLDCY